MFSASRWSAFAALILAALTGSVVAQQPQSAQANSSDKAGDIRAQLAKKLPGAKAEDVRPTPIAGMYEISLGTSTAYISADGKYLISGDLYEIDSKRNLTDQRRAEVRVRSLAELKDSDTIIFGPAAAKHTVTVFTDPDCGYCRRLHSEIAELNRLGVRVRYAAYPRSGPGTGTWNKMEAVWCAKDRRDALTRAKLGEDVGTAKCGATPIASQYKLGEEIGVNGTPAIFTEAGDYIGGYLPPQRLVEYLNELRGAVAKSGAR
jgi:thiol:disulfide interchange protein DsbC